MAPPSLAVRRFTFYHEVAYECRNDSDDASVAEGTQCGGGKKKIPVACITAQLLCFGRRCFWVHLSETRENSNAPLPFFGPCAVAFSGVASAPVSASLIDVPLVWQRDHGEFSVAAPNPQSVFAQGLAQRLASCLQRDCGSEGVAVYVACGITGENVELLGTPTGCLFDVTVRFGAVVFRNVLELIREQGACAQSEGVM